MGNNQPKKQPRDMNQVLFKLKMAAKRFEKQSKKALKEKNKNMGKAKKCLLRGDEDGAKLYAMNAQNNEAESKKYLNLSSKLDAMTSKMKSNHNSADIMTHIANEVTPKLVEESESMDIKTLVNNFDQFQNAFDKMTVNANIVGQNFNQMTSEGNTIQNADNLLNQLKNEVQFDMNGEQTMPQELQTNKKKEEEVDPVQDYLAKLKQE